MILQSLNAKMIQLNTKEITDMHFLVPRNHWAFTEELEDPEGSPLVGGRRACLTTDIALVV